MNKITILLILFVIPFLSSAQKAEKYKFKKISKDLLIEKEHPLYPDAVAAFDQNRCEIRYEYNSNTGFICVTEIVNRIKIYKEGGKSYGDFEFQLYKKNKSEREKIAKMEAFTFNMKDGEITKTKLEKNDIYITELNENFDSYAFAMPNVQEGSVIEVRYLMETPFFFSIDPFYMQKMVPVNNLYYHADFPEYFSYNPIIRGALNIKEEQTTGSGSLTLNSNQEKIQYRSDDWKFQGKNIPPIVPEPYVHNMRNYMSAISWELRSTNFPGSFVENYNTTWDKVATLLNDSRDFGRFIRANNKEIKELTDLVAAMDDKEKINTIYSYISNQFTWNGKYSEYGGNMRKLLESKEGNSGQINLLLVNVLQKAGINALPIVLKTRSRGYLNVTFPTLGDLNYVIVGIETPKGMLFLDATTPMLPMGNLPTRALNLHGVIINGDKGIKIDISSPNKANYTHFVQAELNAEGELKGVIQSKYSKYSNYNERLQIAINEGEENYYKTLESNNSNIELSNFSLNNYKDTNKSLTVNMDADYSNLIQEIDGKLFIPALLNLGIKENPFREGERKYNLYFSTLHSSKEIVSIIIPEGYEIESLPEPLALTLPDKSLVYRYNISQVNNTLNISSFVDRKKDNISFDLYPNLRELYEEILKKNNEQIVLVKK